MKLFIALSAGLLLAGCATTTKPVQVYTQPVKTQIAKPAQPRPVVLGNVNWMVVNKENLQEFIDKQAKLQNTNNPVFVAITVEDYKQLSLNLAEIKRYIKQQKTIIVYYENAVSQ